MWPSCVECVCVWSNQPVFTCCVQHSGIETPQHQTLISPNTGSACQFRIWKVRISIPRSRLSRPSFLTLHQSRNSTDVTIPSLNRFIHRHDTTAVSAWFLQCPCYTFEWFFRRNAEIPLELKQCYPCGMSRRLVHSGNLLSASSGCLQGPYRQHVGIILLYK